MGTTFVSIDRNDSHPSGFWMRDGWLELWLRLLALHLPEPNHDDEHLELTLEIRNRWLLASKGYFNGCVPHDMEFACDTDAGKKLVRSAIDSLMTSLQKSDLDLDSGTLNLLGLDGGDFTKGIERRPLLDIGNAFVDLLEGRINGPSQIEKIMPGSIPYKRPE